MKYNVFGYLIGEGFRNTFKNKKSTGASIMIMCATMLIFGLFFLIGENVNHMVKEIESQQGMSAFIVVGTDSEEVQKIGENIRNLPYVGKVDFVSKDEGMNYMKEKLGEQTLTGYINKNPLPDSYTVTLTDLTKADEVQAKIEEMEYVDEVVVGSKTIKTLVSVANGIQIVSGVILILLVVISIFIIANTIKLTVHARRKEISIMKYVGATNSFIRGPFIVEGIIIGILSALLSIVVVGVSYNLVLDKILVPSLSQLQLNVTFLTFTEMFPLILTVYLVLGVGIGVLGSTISMKKYLEV